MKRYTVLGCMSFMMVLFFQNCGKPPATMDTTPQTTVASPNQQFNKYTVDSVSTLSIWDYIQNRFLVLDLKTGQMQALEEGGQAPGATFNLASDKLTEVQTLLKDAEVCEPIVDPKDLEGRLCTMAYRYPYAVLSENGDEVRLGERATGCDVPVDLCGDKASQLQTWSRSVVESL